MKADDYIKKEREADRIMNRALCQAFFLNLLGAILAALIAAMLASLI